MAQPGFRTVQNEVVVVAVRKMQLVVIRFDIRADFFLLCKIKGRSGNLPDLTGRDRKLICRGKGIRVDPDLLVQDGACAVSCEIEIGVIGRIDDCSLVGRRLISDLQGILLSQRVRDREFQISRESLLPVF